MATTLNATSQSNEFQTEHRTIPTCSPHDEKRETNAQRDKENRTDMKHRPAVKVLRQNCLALKPRFVGYTENTGGKKNNDT
jgi:hypothetical protein